MANGIPAGYTYVASRSGVAELQPLKDNSLGALGEGGIDMTKVNQTHRKQLLADQMSGNDATQIGKAEQDAAKYMRMAQGGSGSQLNVMA